MQRAPGDCDDSAPSDNLPHLCEFNQAQAKKAFPQFNFSKFFVPHGNGGEPLVFCNFAGRKASKDGGGTAYDHCTDLHRLKEIVEFALGDYNELNPVMNLVLFSDALFHVCRMARIITAPAGTCVTCVKKIVMRAVSSRAERVIRTYGTTEQLTWWPRCSSSFARVALAFQFFHSFISSSCLEQVTPCWLGSAAVASSRWLGSPLTFANAQQFSSKLPRITASAISRVIFWLRQ